MKNRREFLMIVRILEGVVIEQGRDKASRPIVCMIQTLSQACEELRIDLGYASIENLSQNAESLQFTLVPSTSRSVKPSLLCRIGCIEESNSPEVFSMFLDKFI